MPKVTIVKPKRTNAKDKKHAKPLHKSKASPAKIVTQKVNYGKSVTK